MKARDLYECEDPGSKASVNLLVQQLGLNKEDIFSRYPEPSTEFRDK